MSELDSEISSSEVLPIEENYFNLLKEFVPSEKHELLRNILAKFLNNDENSFTVQFCTILGLNSLYTDKFISEFKKETESLSESADDYLKKHLKNLSDKIDNEVGQSRYEFYNDLSTLLKNNLANFEFREEQIQKIIEDNNSSKLELNKMYHKNLSSIERSHTNLDKLLKRFNRSFIIILFLSGFITGMITLFIINRAL